MERQRRFGGVAGTLGLVGVVGALVLALGGFLGTWAERGGAAQPAIPVTIASTPGASVPSEMDAVAVAERVAPAVVTVINLQTAGAFDSGATQAVGSGTGFIIDQQGHIVTNNHVVEGGDQFQVIFANGEERSAAPVGADPVADLAVVRIEGGIPATVPFGSSDALRVGQEVLAVGSPLGAFTNTVTEGIVSALNRTFPEPGFETYTNLIQHDAAINPGNSGGPLFNAAGEVIGVNTLGIQTAQGIFFAIPSSTVTEVVTTLINEGRVRYPYLNVSTSAVTSQIAAQEDLPVDYGVFVQRAPQSGPAGQAGIEPGDIILALNGQRIDAQNPFVEVLFQFEPGQTVTATIQRGSEQRDVQVTLGERPPDLQR